jgi:hypothetical protein
MTKDRIKVGSFYRHHDTLKSIYLGVGKLLSGIHYEKDLIIFNGANMGLKVHDPKDCDDKNFWDNFYEI